MISGATAAAWICFGVGGVIVIVGVLLGCLHSDPKQRQAEKKLVAAKAKVTEAQAKLGDAQNKLVAAKTAIQTLATLVAAPADPNAAPDPNAPTDPTAAAASATAAAAEPTAAAAGLLDDLSGILGAFPIPVRFYVFLVLIGAALMSVAIVQFGGHSIF